jgi:nucleoside-diphosphate-sugar epimerase
MKVLVTGATGFIGAYVIEALKKRRVSIIATSASAEKAAARPYLNDVSYFEIDLSQLDENINYFEKLGRPDKVIHLAWPGLPDYKSLLHYEKYLPESYAFIKNLVVNGCKDVTVTGTCFEYGMKTGRLSESDPAEPSNPYGLAKLCLYRFLSELKKQHAFSLKWPRLFYMYGRGQNPRSLFAQLDKALEEKQEVFNMSGGEQVRDFLPVEKVAEYIVRIAMQTEVEGLVNCCSGRPMRIVDLVRDYIAARKGNIKLNLGYYPYPDYEPMEFWGDNHKLQTILNEQ